MIAAEISPSAIDGDAGARLDALARKHLDLVYAAALRQVRDPHMAADVTQAVFMLLQKKHVRFGPGTIVSAWLLRATRYTCLTALHQRRRASHHERKAAAMRAESPVEVSPETAEWAAMIDAALERLGRQDREAIAATYFEGMSRKQMGERMGITEAAAHKRVQRALTRLRRLLERKDSRISVSEVAGAVAMIAKPATAPAAVGNAVMASLGGHAPAGVSILVKGTTIMVKAMKAKAAVVLVMAVAGVGLLGTATYQRVFAQAAGDQTPHTAPPLPVAPNGGANAADFGAAVELTVKEHGTQNSAVDFDSAKTLSLPNFNSAFEMANWIDQAGMDAIYDGTPGSEALEGFEMAVVPCPPGQFESAESIVKELMLTEPGMPAMINAHKESAEFLFRTREGGVGVLEIVAIQQNPNTVRIRYKLLTAEARDKAAELVATRDILPEVARLAKLVMAATDAKDGPAATDALQKYSRAMRICSETIRGTPKWSAFSRAASLTNVAFLTMAEAEGKPEKLAAALAEVRRTVGPLVMELGKGAQQGMP